MQRRQLLLTATQNINHTGAIQEAFSLYIYSHTYKQTENTEQLPHAYTLSSSFEKNAEKPRDARCCQLEISEIGLLLKKAFVRKSLAR